MLSLLIPKAWYSSWGEVEHFKLKMPPWLVRLSGLGAGPRTKGSLVQFPVRAHAWVAGQVPSRGRTKGNHTLMFLSLPPSLLSNNE